MVCSANLTLPHSGQPAWVKSHDWFDSHFSADEIPSQNVRLVRNPGDQILRNFVRWNNKQNLSVTKL